MAYKETFWMACDSTEQLRAEYGPFHTRTEAEIEAKKLGFGYLLRYEHLLGANDEIEEVRCIFVELPEARRRLGSKRSQLLCTPVALPVAKRLRMKRDGRPRCGPTSTNLNTRAIGYAFLNTPAVRA